MEDTYKFPGGYDVKVVRKRDIIDCIDSNIVDKEVALEIIKQCECDAIGFLRQGRWAGIPFIGSIRENRVKKIEKSKEHQDLLNAAYSTATKEQYILFRKELNHETHKRLKANKYYAFVLASAVKRNKEVFYALCKEHGEKFARLHFCFTPSGLVRNYLLDYGEDINDR